MSDFDAILRSAQLAKAKNAESAAQARLLYTEQVQAAKSAAAELRAAASLLCNSYRANGTGRTKLEKQPIRSKFGGLVQAINEYRAPLVWSFAYKGISLIIDPNAATPCWIDAQGKAISIDEFASAPSFSWGLALAINDNEKSTVAVSAACSFFMRRIANILVD